MMELSRNKAKALILSIEEHCNKRGIKISPNKSIRMLWAAKEIIKRYHSVVLREKGMRFLCNNPKYLKKWTFKESLKKTSPLKEVYKPFRINNNG